MTQADEERTAARRAGEPENWDAKVLNDLMATPQGRFWMERLLDRCGAGHAVYGHDGDALGMAWRDGRGDIGRYLMSQLESYCPDLYLRMLRDRRTRVERAREKAEREEARRSGESEAHSGVTAIEELADTQRREAEAEAARQAAAAKKQPKA